MVEKQEVNAYLIAAYHSVLIEKSVLDALTKRGLRWQILQILKQYYIQKKQLSFKKMVLIVVQTSPRMTKTV